MNIARLTISLSNFPPFHHSNRHPFPRFEFHILAETRNRYKFDESLFSTSGNVIFPNFRAARVFVKKMNDQRDLVRHPDQALRAGQLNALGLIDEIYHYILRAYEETTNAGVFARAHERLIETLETGQPQSTIDAFVTLFPPLDVFKEKVTAKEYLDGKSVGRPNFLMADEELLLLYFVNFNPAAKKFNELFTDAELARNTKYQTLLAALENFFKAEKPFGPENQSIFDLLRAPILAHPDSLEAQLGFMKSKWGMVLSQKFLDKILGSMDLLQEENKTVFGGAGPTNVPVYKGEGLPGQLAYGSYEAERFTTDLDWMPKVVLLAKNTYVWLDQLSKKYKRAITRLDQIPDEELDQLARWNFTGLWLIGLWERSNASQKIKQWTGNPEAVPSAYSLYDYEIAGDLGGEAAFQNLNHRAWQRGIRLAGDMVPNHMGIYSKWIVEHPEYFIQSEQCPFPNYRFTGGDLSESPDVQLRIEDGYWSRTDAAVVFQRIDNRSGKVTYIYHGNDGTNMPWNDTAQLDLLRSDVREAVIGTIFHVARKFSIIRFDAAMTLTKKHFQRLWYPQPGTGGDIPSRADHALSKEKFDAAFPSEFWRDVVDRINQSMPSTLLLAEAFWLMEGYFVRTLGMHRVYNSAFMHMLMKEENEKYHLLIKNTLEFNPEILKRYVNFMSNPDEQTSIAQFGKDDKCFGVALMMVTLPGLPMFGHGQIEGFTEKYGMEYKRAYYDEVPDDQLVRRHEHEIFPIMKKRHLFSDVTNFELYDFHDSRGFVNQNVFAYSNMSGNERALIFYHNKYQECKGSIRWASQKSAAADGGTRTTTVKTIGDALAINGGEHHFYIFKDYKTDLEYVRPGRDLHDRGIYAELKAFSYHVFLDFREIYDEAGEYSRLARKLKGRGVPSINQALIELRQTPIHDAMRALFAEENIATLRAHCFASTGRKAVPKKMDELEIRFGILMDEISKHLRLEKDVASLKGQFMNDLNSVAGICALGKTSPKKKVGSKKPSRKSPKPRRDVLATLQNPERWLLLAVWLVTDRIASIGSAFAGFAHPADPLTTLNLEKPLAKIFSEHGLSREQTHRGLNLLRIMTKHPRFLSDAALGKGFLKFDQLLDDYDVREFLKVNLYNGIWYYNRECFEELLDAFLLVGVVRSWKSDGRASTANVQMIEEHYRLVHEIEDRSAESNFDVERLRLLLSPEGI